MSPFRADTLEEVPAAFQRDTYPVTATSVPGLRYECPCCRYPMLTERGGFEICRLCGWEDDGQDDADADRVLGGPNYELSLTAARDNFRRHLEAHAPGSKRFRAPTAAESAAKRQIMNAFDALKTEPGQRKIWEQVAEGERILAEELDRRVRAVTSAR